MTLIHWLAKAATISFFKFLLGYVEVVTNNEFSWSEQALLHLILFPFTSIVSYSPKNYTSIVKYWSKISLLLWNTDLKFHFYCIILNSPNFFYLYQKNIKKMEMLVRDNNITFQIWKVKKITSSKNRNLDNWTPGTSWKIILVSRR